MYVLTKLVRPGSWVLKHGRRQCSANTIPLCSCSFTGVMRGSHNIYRKGLIHPRTLMTTTPPIFHGQRGSIKLHCAGWWRSPAVRLRSARPLPLLLHRCASDDKHYRRTNPLPEEEGEEEGEQQPHNEWSWLPLYTIIAALAYILTSSAEPVPEISFPFFLQHMLYAGEVQRLEVNSTRDRVYVYLHYGALINGREIRRYGPQFMFTISGVDSLEAKLNQAQDELGILPSDRIPVNYRAQSETMALVMAAAVTMAIIWVVFYFVIRRNGAGKSGKGPISLNPFSYMSQARTTIITEPTQGSVRFSEVAGMEEAKEEVMEFIDYLRHPKRYSELGARIPKGALLHGPPGTGKTLLARAIASEASVPFLSIAGSDFVEMFAGVGSARVRDLFSQARKHAPCIVYIDEIDAVGRSRRSGAIEGHNEQENTLNQLLVEMDGINPLEGVVMLASTNRVDILDQALLRPGRFDRQISIDLPTLPERKAIFEVYLRKVLLEKSVESYSSRLAALTPGQSGADIANIVNEGALHAAREKGAIVKERDFEYAIERIIAGMEKRSSTMTPEERKVVAYHEAGHALTGWMLEHTDPVMKVSIIPRTKGALGFAQYLPSEQRLYSTEQIFDRICMTLGGRVAEALTFRKISTGAQDDLEKVTDLAYRQVVEYGMSPRVGHVSFPIKKREEIGRKIYSEKLSKMIDEEVRLIVKKAYQKTESLLRGNSEKLKVLAEALLEREVLNYGDVITLLGPMPHEKKFHQHKELVDLW